MPLPKILAVTLLFSLWLPCAARAQGIVINAVGDIMLAGSGTATFARLGYDYPFMATLKELKNCDIAVGNLEAPLTLHGTEFTDKRFRFRVSPRAAQALRKAGFSVLTLANNHMMDFGSEGLGETIRHLESQGIAHAGAGEELEAARREAVVAVGGKKVAFLAYSITLPEEFYATVSRPGTAPGYPSYYVEDIRRARERADHVVVSFHWGSERADTPHPYQVAAAHRAIDAGADLVIGHHPHVLQGIERYKGGVILYSLGNFAFGTTSCASDRSVIARITLEDGVREVELIPLNVLNREVSFQPRVLRGRRGEEVIARLNRLSEGLGSAVRNDGGRYLVQMDGEGRRLAQK